MEEWKVRQTLFHRLNTTHTDDLNDKEIQLTEDIVSHAIDYFKSKDIGWIYPSKSYMVAICYSRWLAEYFGGRPIEYLNDPDLLFGNDPYFVQYSLDVKSYNEILNQISWNFDETQGMIPDVRKYFEEEFMICMR